MKDRKTSFMAAMKYMIILAALFAIGEHSRVQAKNTNDELVYDTEKLLEVLEDEIKEEELEEEDFTDIEDEIHHQRKDPWFIPKIDITRRRCRNPKRAGTCHNDANGCGLEIQQIFFSLPNSDVFKPACDKHDICYGCGIQRHWSRAQCDDRFFSDLKEICDCRFNSVFDLDRRGECHALAALAYGSVKAGGSIAYSNPSQWYCANNCIVSLGSPHVPYK